MRKKNIISNVDWLVIVVYLIMVLAGWLNIYSAVYNEEHSSIFDISQRYGKQMIWIGLALIIALFVVIIDSKFFVSFAYPIYGFFIFLLLLVLFIGKEVNGARSWFVLGGFAFQPAEFAKLGTSLAIAKLISSYSFSLKNYKTVSLLLMIIALPMAMIVLQNDTGSALVYFVFVIVLFREGLSGVYLFFGVLIAVLFLLSLILSKLTILIFLIAIAVIAYSVLSKNWKHSLSFLSIWALSTIVVGGLVLFLKDENPGLYFILLRSSILTGLIVLFYSFVKRINFAPALTFSFMIALAFTYSVDFVFNKVLETHQRSRINNLLGLESDPLGIGYNVNQSKIAIGSGGIGGKGFLNGTQTKFNFVPEQSTDFIFCTVGEEWGFLGAFFVISLFVLLMLRLIFLAERQRSKFSRIYGYSVVSILFFHFSINIGMTIGLAPVIGIPLPFFSYGGSSLWFFTLLLFIFLRLDANRLDQLH